MRARTRIHACILERVSIINVLLKLCSAQKYKLFLAWVFSRQTRRVSVIKLWEALLIITILMCAELRDRWTPGTQTVPLSMAQSFVVTAMTHNYRLLFMLTESVSNQNITEYCRSNIGRRSCIETNIAITKATYLLHLRMRRMTQMRTEMTFPTKPMTHHTGVV